MESGEAQGAEESDEGGVMLTRKPVKGDQIRWPKWKQGRVAIVVSTPKSDDDLCWIREDEGAAMPFLWRTTRGMNPLAELVEHEPGADLPRS